MLGHSRLDSTPLTIWALEVLEIGVEGPVPYLIQGEGGLALTRAEWMLSA